MKSLFTTDWGGFWYRYTKGQGIVVAMQIEMKNFLEPHITRICCSRVHLILGKDHTF